MKELKKAIIKAVPSIMELKFGCEILLNDEDGGAIKTRIIRKVEDREIICDFLPAHNHKIKDIKKILGRPITLADVILALEKYNSELKSPTLSFRHYYKNGLQIESEGRLLAVWNLEENLDGQNKETIKVLRKLLKESKNE